LHVTILLSSAPDRRMRPSHGLLKLKLDSFIQIESFAMNTENEFLARDILPSVDFSDRQDVPDRRMIQVGFARGTPPIWIRTLRRG